MKLRVYNRFKFGGMEESFAQNYQKTCLSPFFSVFPRRGWIMFSSYPSICPIVYNS